MSGLSSKLAGAKFPHRDVTICLDADLTSEWQDAELEYDRAVAAAEKAAKEAEDGKGDARLGASPAGAVKRAEKKRDEVSKRLRAAAIKLRITGVSFGQYNAYVVQNPPRKDVSEMFDTTKFYMHVARRTAKYIDDSGTAHEVDASEWDEIESKLTDADHDRIADAVLAVNRQDSTRGVHFLSSNSEQTTASSETSEQPEG